MRSSIKVGATSPRMCFKRQTEHCVDECDPASEISCVLTGKRAAQIQVDRAQPINAPVPTYDTPAVSV